MSDEEREERVNIHYNKEVNCSSRAKLSKFDMGILGDNRVFFLLLYETSSQQNQYNINGLLLTGGGSARGW